MRTVSVIAFSMFLLFSATSALALTCSESCKKQCKKGWLGDNVDPACFEACKAWQLVKCYKVNDPWVSSMGEAGARAYPAAAEIMRGRNQGFGRLTRVEKQILSKEFGDLVEEVTVHYGASLMSQWGSPPLEISFFNDAGQTYGRNIYIRAKHDEISPLDRVVLIGHEMCHSRQYKQRGSSYQRFGRDYFEGFAKGGGYANNSMEKECEQIEGKIYQLALRANVSGEVESGSWSFEACNRSGFDSLYVAIAKPHAGGVSLAPIPWAKGWFEIKRGQCSTLFQSEVDEPLYALATTGGSGNWMVWNGNNTGKKFCIDPSLSFEIKGDEHYYCREGNHEKMAFQFIENPRRQGRPVNSIAYGGDPTKLRVCNRANQKLFASMWRGDRGFWRAEGWYPFDSNDCHDFALGVYAGSVFLHAFNADRTRTWGSQNEPFFCVAPEGPFELRDAELPSCASPNYLVRGARIDLKAGQNTFEFSP